MIKILSFLGAITAAISLVGCGGGGSSSTPAPVTVVPPTPPSVPVGFELDFSTAVGVSVSFSGDDTRFGLVTNDNRNVFRIYDFVDYPNDLKVVDVANFRHNGAGDAHLTRNGKFALLHGTPNTSNVDPDRYTTQFAEGENNRNRVSFVGDVETGVIYPMDVFETGQVIVSDSFPVAMNTSTGIVYHYSFNINGDTSLPSENYTIYGYSFAEEVITQEVDISQYNCGNTVTPGDYNPERNRVAFVCAGTSIIEILGDGTTEQIFPNEPISFIGGLEYVDDKVWGNVFGGPVRTSGYTVDLTTGDAEIISPQEFAGEVFAVSEDLRYNLFYTGDHVTSDDVDTDQESFDTWVCRTGEGALGCTLLDSDLAEVDFDIARYIFKDGRRLIGRTEIQDNPIFSE